MSATKPCPDCGRPMRAIRGHHCYGGCEFTTYQYADDLGGGSMTHDTKPTKECLFESRQSRIADSIRILGDMVESHDGGDRPPSPPAALLRALEKLYAKKTLLSRLELMGARDSTLVLELDRYNFTTRQIDAIIDALDLIHRRHHDGSGSASRTEGGAS